MTIAPFVENPEENREVFKKLYEFAVDIGKKNIDNVTMDVLSMGMTGDYQVAIEEGATMVRVGTGISVPGYMVLPSKQHEKRIGESKMSLLGKLMDTMRLSSEDDEDDYYLDDGFEDEAPKKRKKKRVNAFMDGDEDAIDYNDDDPEDEEVTKQIQLFHMMKKIQTMKRVKSKLTMLKSMKSYQMIWVRKLN